jgi:hypothetical protein
MQFVYLVYGQQYTDSEFFLSAIFEHRGEAQKRAEAFERKGLKAYVRTEEVLRRH